MVLSLLRAIRRLFATVEVKQEIYSKFLTQITGSFAYLRL